ncbi:MAG: insulinase family protein [Muribaculaceae bacterium]|nr:insulinase family protein [Muribaculaceae bacterium]
MLIDRTIAPQVNEFGFFKLETPRRLVTPSGTTVDLLEKGDEDVCMLTVLFPSGEMESPSNELLRLLAAVWREGTMNLTADEVADRLDFYGAWTEITTSLHYTHLTLYALTSRLKELLPLFADIILHPLLSDEPLQRMKIKLCSNLKIMKEKVKVVAKRLMKEQMLGSEHPEARMQTEQGFNDVTSEMLREHHRLITSTRPVVMLAGKVTADVVAATLEFAENITPVNPYDAKNKILPPAPGMERRVHKLMSDKEQTAVVMSFPAIPRTHPDYNDLRIAVMLLGGYFGSRLMTNIREEKGYTYGINASLIGCKEIYYIAIECECDNANVEGVISETRNELRRLATEPVGEEELTVVKRIIKSSLASMLDDPFDMAGYYVGQIYLGYPEDYFVEQQNALDAITPQRIMELARQYLNPEKMYIATAGGCKPSAE